MVIGGSGGGCGFDCKVGGVDGFDELWQGPMECSLLAPPERKTNIACSSLLH